MPAQHTLQIIEVGPDKPVGFAPAPETEPTPDQTVVYSGAAVTVSL